MDRTSTSAAAASYTRHPPRSAAAIVTTTNRHNHRIPQFRHIKQFRHMFQNQSHHIMATESFTVRRIRKQLLDEKLQRKYFLIPEKISHKT